MLKQCDKMAENLLNLVKTNLLTFSFFSVKAEEDPNPAPPSPTPTPSSDPTPSINYEQLITAARKEEKEKLYPRIKKLEEENKNLLTSNNTNLLKVAELQNKLDSIENSKVNMEEYNSMKGKVETLTKENEELKQKQPPDETAIRAEVEKEYQVKIYRVEKLNELKDEILPVFADLVIGKTQEEVDASLETAKSKTIETKKSLGLIDENGNPITTTTIATQKPTPPAANPGSSRFNDKTFDMKHIQNLDPSSPEYAEWRKSVGLK